MQKKCTFACQINTVLKTMRHLQNKSGILEAAAKLLHREDYYPAVAHSAYYSCFQLFKHIWLHSLLKTENDLSNELRQYKATNGDIGSHEFLINQIVLYIKKTGKKDCSSHALALNNKIIQLKRLRQCADYEDSLFDSSKSSHSLSLSADIIPILKQY